MMKQPVRIPSVVEIGELEKDSLTAILEEVCKRLYRLMTRQEYDKEVLGRLRTVSQGMKALRKFVAWTIKLLEKKYLLQTVN